MQVLNNNRVGTNLPALKSYKKERTSSSKPFIQANTEEVTLEELRNEHIIPVFSATNERLISHQEIIETVLEAINDHFPFETILNPSIRVSHPIKGRVPEAKHKSLQELESWEQTLYYERMAFLVEIPGIRTEVAGNQVSLTVGGVKSYNHDNLYGKRTDGGQRVQLFMGFKNQVCCNLCVNTDGVKVKTGIKSIHQLKVAAERMLEEFRLGDQLGMLRKLDEFSLTEEEFAHFVGKARMLKHLPEVEKKGIPLLQFGDHQMGSVVKSYYKDENFCTQTGSIDFWRLYNLLTEVNKSSYIDKFIERGINAGNIINELILHKSGKKKSWYLN